MKTTALALLLAAPVYAFEMPKIAPNNAAAAAELKLALEAHMDGSDAKARRHLAACVKKAAPDSPDLSGCRIYLEWWAKGVKQVDKPSNPQSRLAYSIGVDAYKKGDLGLADFAWHECLGLSVTGTAVRNDCMAMIDLIPRRPLSTAAAKLRETYMEGFVAYGVGDFAKARAKWTACVAATPMNDPTWSDCQAGLRKLDADKPKP